MLQYEGDALQSIDGGLELHPSSMMMEEEGEMDDCKILLKCWLNEKLSPTLLPYAGDVVSNILELISNQVINLLPTIIPPALNVHFAAISDGKSRGGNR